MNKNENEFQNQFNEALERLELLTEELRRIKRAIIATQNGEPFTEAWNEEVFEESYSDRKDDCITEVGIVIEHLLKLKYCTNDWNHKVWINSVETHRGTLYGYLQWLTRKPVTRFINYIEENLEESYIAGINLYTRAAKKYPDLEDGLSKIPEECPWTLWELMDESIEYLLEKLDKNGGIKYE